MTDPATARLAFLRGGRAVRSFRPDPVPAEAVREILEVARRSGSSGSRQPWDFIVVRSPQTLAELSRLVPNATTLASAPLALVVVMPGGQVALDAYDEGRVTERILLAARAQGLAGVIGWVLADERGPVRALLGIPDARLVRTIISIGLPAEPTTPPPAQGPTRRSLDELVHPERW